MRDAHDVVLYIGKAKNLRKRLGSYRVANPDRMPRRHLRLLRAVARIELQECPDESSALARESDLLKRVRPKFNRAGTWQAPPRFFAWRCVEQRLCLAVTQTPDSAWRLHGPLGRGAEVLRAVLARLLWTATHTELGFVSLPVGWSQERLETETAIDCGLLIEPIATRLEQLLTGQEPEFCDWIRSQLPRDLHPFEKTAVEADLELLKDAVRHTKRGQRNLVSPQ
jgi:predicted GIY-YIG superfamily endonuclease